MKKLTRRRPVNLYPPRSFSAWRGVVPSHTGGGSPHGAIEEFGVGAARFWGNSSTRSFSLGHRCGHGRGSRRSRARVRVYANEERGKRGGKSSLAHVLPSFPSSFPPPPLPFFLLFIRSGHACGAGRGRGGEGRVDDDWGQRARARGGATE